MKETKTLDEWKFTNQSWKKVLTEICNYAPNRYGRGKDNYGDSHPLAKHLKITPYELSMIMSFLTEQKLIEYDASEHNWVNLTQKGFDVALQNQNIERTSKINKASLFFSAAIIVFAAINLFLAVVNNFIQDIYVIGFIIVLILIIAFVVLWNDIRTM